MNKCRNIIAVILCVAMLGSVSVGCTSAKDKEAAGNTTSSDVQSETTPQQAKLNIVRPQAYSSIEGLNPEAGSYISIIGKSLGGEYWKEVKAGAEQAVKELNEALGYKGEDKIKVNYSGPSQAGNVDEQINILDEELARYPSALGIANIDATASQVQFELAAENDIPLITLDSGSEYQGMESVCATNNLEAAQTAAVKLSSLMEDKGEIALFVHDSKSTTAKERETGFVEEIKANNPDISVVNIYHLDELEDMARTIAQEKSTPDQVIDPTSLQQEDAIKYIFEKNSNIKGCYTTDAETTQLVADYLETLESEELYVVGFDAGEAQLEAISEGIIDGLVVQNPYGMGYATVIACLRSALQMGNEAFVDTGYTWVTKDNLNSDSIQKML